MSALNMFHKIANWVTQTYGTNVAPLHFVTVNIVICKCLISLFVYRVGRPFNQTNYIICPAIPSNRCFNVISLIYECGSKQQVTFVNFYGPTADFRLIPSAMSNTVFRAGFIIMCSAENNDCKCSSV